MALSITDAEYVAAAEVSKEAVWIRGFVNDLAVPDMHYPTMTLYMDNHSAKKLTRNPEFHNRTKYIDIRYHIRHHFVRERVMEVGDLVTERVDISTTLRIFPQNRQHEFGCRNW